MKDYKIYFTTDLEDGYSWINDFVYDEDEDFSCSQVEITSENFDLFPLDGYLDAINRKLESWNYHGAMGFVDEIADRMKLIGISENVIKKMFYNWTTDKGLCLDFRY